jgi:hypothetical protein
MAVQIQLRNDTAANWESENPLLAQGEVGVELVTNRQKIGTGLDNWNDLAYVDSYSSQQLQTHVNGSTPHPAYDDIQSLTLLFENGLV